MMFFIILHDILQVVEDIQPANRRIRKR